MFTIQTTTESLKLPQNEIYLNRAHWPVTTLGYGKRVGIWFQGCSIGCKGCCAKDTWEIREESVASVVGIMEWIETLPVDQIDGFTLSGGEPFDQPEQLKDLTLSIRAAFGSGRDILVYSGYPYKKLVKNHPDILALVDVLVAEPFIESRPGAFLRGSDNQVLHLQTQTGQQRYSGLPVNSKDSKGIQIHFDGSELIMIGIPDRGDLQKLEELLAAEGIRFGALSWN